MAVLNRLNTEMILIQSRGSCYHDVLIKCVIFETNGVLLPLLLILLKQKRIFFFLMMH